jgi:hypothetical protein
MQRFRRAARLMLVSNSAMPADKSVEELPAPVLVSNSAMPVDKSVEQLPAPARPNLRLQRFKRAARLVLFSKSAMPVDKSVEQLTDPADTSFSSPVKTVRESNGEKGESHGMPNRHSKAATRHSKAATTLTNLSAH